MTEETKQHGVQANHHTGPLSNDSHLDQFAELADCWFFEQDETLRFTSVSPSMAQMTGIPADEIIGQTPQDALTQYVLPAEHKKWQAHIDGQQDQRSWEDFICTLAREGGKRQVLSTSGRAKFDSRGRFAGFRGVGRDITRRSVAETRLRSILDTVPDAIITIDETATVNSFSQTAERLFGYTADEVIGKNINLLMPQPYKREHDGYMERYIRTGQRRIIGIGREVEAQRKDGTIFPINLSVNEMHVEGKRMFTGVVHDTTELKTAQNLNTRVGEILDRSLNEIYVFDAQSLKFSQINFGARQNMGYSSREFRDLTPVDIKPEMTQQQFDELLSPLRSGDQKLLVFKTIHKRKNRSTYPVEVHLQLMHTENPPVFVAVVQDITELERREAQLRQSQKMEAIGQLTGGIAHDFNNLLTVIIGNNELLADFLKDDFQRGLLEDSTAAAENAAQLTSQLLAFARQQPLDPRVLEINDLIEDMADMLRRSLGENIILKTSLEPDLRKALADPVQLHNAVLNLAINARDAMPHGGELIIETSNMDIDADAASIRNEARPGRYIRLSVRDTGTGMTPDIQSRILEPFFTTKEQGKGTGLGLSMVHGFAQQSGGFMEIYSEVGFGTAISFYLPDAEDAPEKSQDANNPAIPGQTMGKTILVVEDDPRVRKISVKRLQHLGYKTVEAESGRQALDLLSKENTIDLVFSDMVMPGMTGAELLETVAKLYPSVKRLVTSGYAEDGTLPNNGAKWLRKPYSIQEMATAFEDILA